MNRRAFVIGVGSSGHHMALAMHALSAIRAWDHPCIELADSMVFAKTLLREQAIPNNILFHRKDIASRYSCSGMIKEHRKPEILIASSIYTGPVIFQP